MSQKIRVMFPIGVKLVLIISILLLASLGIVILMVSILSTQEVQKTAEDNNFTVNQRAASQAEDSINSVQAAVLLYLEMTDWVSPAFNRSPEMERFFFSRNRNIAAIGITQGGIDGKVKTGFIPNSEFLNSNDINAAKAETYLASDFPAIENQIRLFNAAPVFQLSLISAVFIRQGRTGNETVKVLFTPDELSESFGTGINTSFLINDSGNLLLHPDNDLILGGANLSALPIVSVMQQQGDKHRQVSYLDNGVEYFGAYYRLSGMDAAVITTISHDIVFEAVRSLTRQNMFLTAVVLFLAIILIWFFSKTITSPVRVLADAALRIERGEFEIKLEKRTNDEVGLLTDSFDNMSRALSIFGRFTNKEIAIRAMRGEIKPGGFPKHATILFTDIRGFTEKTENFDKIFGEDAPNNLILWLNDYFTHMIHCVEKTGGVVDKFIGDALMAHWGTAFSAGSPAEDAYNCVKTALLMRETLIELNAGRKKNDPGNPVIQIGCSVNTGMVIAGQIGSDQRMDYTVIGDPVNLANRVEALNKSFGTDILITEDTWKLTGDKFITEEMLPVKVRGKEKPVRLFAVVNFKDSGGPQTLPQLRTFLGIGTPSTSEALVDTDERKYEIQDIKKDEVEKTNNKKINNEKVNKNKISTEAELAVTSFGTTSWVQGQAGKPVPVFFSWNMSGANSATHIIVEVAADPNFTRILEERDVSCTVSVSIPLENGLYCWRVYPANEGSREPLNRTFPSGILMVSTNEKDAKYKVESN